MIPNGTVYQGGEDVMLMAQRRASPGILPGGAINSGEKCGNLSVQYERYTQYNTMKTNQK